ncbi:MAG: hypothetical protein GC189_10670 [Alphaproteobacteria bacterium]|nr:hypothetical protein [Alphaproteobacteria bacterium]
MRMHRAAIALLVWFGAVAHAQPAAPLPLFLTGHWLACAGGETTRETWIAGTNVMVGAGLSHGAGATHWEQMRIERVDGRLTFFGAPMGAAPTPFTAIEQTPTRVVFENAGHDFPQRVIYERRGRRLIGRIEGVSNGEAQEATWTYAPAAANARCR